MTLHSFLKKVGFVALLLLALSVVGPWQYAEALPPGGCEPDDPDCQPAPCDPAADISWGSLSVGGSSASISATNYGESICPNVRLAAYKIYHPGGHPQQISSQTLFDDHAQSIPAGATRTFNVSLPDCNTQVDYFWGPNTPASNPDFGHSPLSGTHMFFGVGYKSGQLCALSTPSCSPGTQTVNIGQQATLNANGGNYNSDYSWTASGGSPSSGTGEPFRPSYSSAGTKQVTVRSSDLTSTACQVTVNSQPVPIANISISPAVIQSGQTTTVGWSSQYANSCTAQGGPGFSTGGATSGSDTSSALTADSTFSVSCTGPGGTSPTSSLTVDVVSCNPSVDLVRSDGQPLNPWDGSEIGKSGSTMSISVRNNSPVCTYNTHLATYRVFHDTGSPYYLDGQVLNDSDSHSIGPGQTVAFSATAATCRTQTDLFVGPSVPQSNPDFGSMPNFTILDWRTDGATLCQDLNISCTTTPTAAATGQVVTRSATASGSQSPYSYSWSGTDGLSGTTPTIQKTYSTVGTKTGTVVATSANYHTNSATCPNVVIGNALAVSCSGNPSAPATGQQVTWTASPSGGTGPFSYSWSGTDSLSGTTQSVNKTYGSVGTKTANISVTDSVGATASNSCTVAVSATPCQGITVTSNAATNWTIAGPGSTTLYSPGYPAYTSSGTYGTGATGTYTLAPAASVPGWANPVVTPAASQTCSSGGTVAYTITYQAQPAYVDIKANGFDGPILIPSGGSAALTWGSAGVTSCTASGGWSGSKPVTNTTGEPTGPITQTTTFTLTCTPGSVTDSVVVGPQGATTGVINVTSNMATTWTLTGPQQQTQTTPSTGEIYSTQQPGAYTLIPESKAGYLVNISPASSQSLSAGGSITFAITYTEDTGGGGNSVDLTADNSDGPLTVITGNKAVFRWTSSGVTKDTCVGSTAVRGGSSWDGPKADENTSGEDSPVITATSTYTITCETAERDVSDSVTIGARNSACTDGADNDGDTSADAADPGCQPPYDQDDDESNALPQCNDGADNTDAEDTLADEDDPGCWENPSDSGTYDPDDTDESNTVVNQCNDGFDNDGDGEVDGEDSNCPGNSEFGTPSIIEI